MTTAAAVRELRARLGETQLEFALRTKIALSSLGRYETGKEPKKSTLKALQALSEEKRFLDLAHVFQESLQARVAQRTRLRALKHEGMKANLASLLVLMDKCRALLEKVNDQLKETVPNSSPELNAHLRRLSEALAEHQKLSTSLHATIQTSTDQCQTAASAR